MAHDQQRQEQAQRYGRVVAKAWQDEAFKQRLLSDPKAVLAEHGIEVPAWHEVRVVENTERVTHLVLPRALSDEQLDQEAGGAGNPPATLTSMAGTGLFVHPPR
jgi:hypothetical protein